MQKSKLARTLRILSADEMKGLHAFLQSPYYNSNSNIIKLYKTLLPYFPDFSSRKLTNEWVFKKLFPGKPYAHQQLLNLMSKFNSILEKYLVVKQLEKKEMEQKKLLVEAYAERKNCYGVFVKKYEQLNQKLDDLPYRDDIYFNIKKELGLMFYTHPETSMQVGDKGSLQMAVKYFEAQKQLTEIKLKCALNARTNTIKDKTPSVSSDLDLLPGNLIYELYNKLESFQRSDASIDFEELVGLFKLSLHVLREDNKRNVLKILLNYCGRKINSGHTGYYRPSLELYKLGLSHNCILTNGKMPDNTFQNIVTSGAICHEFDWTNEFIEIYQVRIESKHKLDAVVLGLGILNFEKKNYDKVIEIMQHTFHEPLNTFKAKSLLIRSWFELWCMDEVYFDLLLSHIETFEKFTRRNKSLPSELKEAFLKFIQYTKKITHSRQEGDTINEIRKEKNLVFKKWLIGKAEKRK